MKKKILLFFTVLSFIAFANAQNSDASGFFMWDEATSSSVLEASINQGVKSYRSRDITILKGQPAWDVFTKQGKNVDVMVAIPINYTWTETPINMTEIAKLINENPFIRRLQIYPKLQPGLMNPSELDPCKDWLTGYASDFESRIRQIDNLVTDKSVEILVAGQMGSASCPDLLQIINTLYDLQSKGRKVAWAVTVYPYYYGNQDNTLITLEGDINGVLANLAAYAPAGKSILPLRVIETGWPSECSEKATQDNQFMYAKTVFSYNKPNVKLYFFELQDYASGWSECEKHFGLWDAAGNQKCSNFLTTEIKPTYNFPVELLVYPNPVQEELNIEYNKIFTAIEIFDITGRKALIVGNINTNKYLVDTSMLNSGAYILTISAENRTYRKIITIQ